ncbi:MAG: hypothetical protein ACXWEY_01580 [Bacteroidia bacterium]
MKAFLGEWRYVIKMKNLSINFKSLFKIEKFIYLTLSIFLLLGERSFGQKNTFITYEVGIPKDKLTFHNPQNNIIFRPSSLGVPGITLTQEIKKFLYFETGAYTDFIGADMVSTGSDTTNLIFAQNQIHFPVRIQLRKSLFKERLNLSISAAPMFVFGWYESPAYGFYSKRNQTIAISHKYFFKENYTLFELGSGIDIRLHKHLFIGLKYRYNLGTKNILDIEAETRRNNSAENANYYLKSNGTYHAFMFSFGYRISKFWNQKKKV